jgi:hypothetical protein
MGGNTGPRKRIQEQAYDTREPLDLRFVGGPFHNERRIVDSDRYYVYKLNPVDAFPLLFPPTDGKVTIPIESVEQGTYERRLNGRRELIMSWLGWDDERLYERTRIDNESPDYHG